MYRAVTRQIEVTEVDYGIRLEVIDGFGEVSQFDERDEDFDERVVWWRDYVQGNRDVSQVENRHVAVAMTETFPKLAETQLESVARHWTDASETKKAVVAWRKAGDAGFKRYAFT